MFVVRWLAPISAIGCVPENQLHPQPEPVVPSEWSETTMASTVGRRFTATYPATPATNWGHWPRRLIVRANGDTRVVVYQTPSALTSPLARAEFDVRSGSTVLELSPAEWEFADSGALDDEGASPVGHALAVEADDPVEVIALVDLNSGDGGVDMATARLLPREELGTRYRVVAPLERSEVEPRTYYDVIATQDDTSVVAEPFGGAILLDAGEYQRVALPTESDAPGRGWLVTSDRPVAVVAGGEPGCAPLPITINSIEWEQIPPVSRWGTDYLALPIDGQASSDLIVAADVDTWIQLDCAEPVLVGAGASLRVPIERPTRVTARVPVGVFVEALPHTCDPATDNSGGALVAVAPRALWRATASVAPIDTELLEILVQLGNHMTTLVSADTDGGDLEATPTPVASSEITTPIDSGVTVLQIGQPTALTSNAIRGLEYVLTPYPHENRPYPDYTDWGQWGDITAVTHLGYDCTDCVPGLTVPATCP